MFAFVLFSPPYYCFFWETPHFRTLIVYSVTILCIEICCLCAELCLCVVSVQSNVLMWCIVYLGILHCTEKACACPFYCCKTRLHRKAINEIIEGIKMTSVCAARPVLNGAVGFLCSSSTAGFLLTALQRKRLPSHMWESNANIWGIWVFRSERMEFLK